jgi:hypothetical protein
VAFSWAAGACARKGLVWKRHEPVYIDDCTGNVGVCARRQGSAAFESNHLFKSYRFTHLRGEIPYCFCEEKAGDL